jgi:hypothetical protein
LGSTCGFYFLIVPSRPEEIRRTVADRVAQRVAGRGISRAAVDSAVGSIGIAAAGLHHVATLEIPASGRPALEAACRALGAQLSIVSGEHGS